jgi:hypothetical protein
MLHGVPRFRSRVSIVDVAADETISQPHRPTRRLSQASVVSTSTSGGLFISCQVGKGVLPFRANRLLSAARAMEFRRSFAVADGMSG